jgi:DNA-binding transcriptional ArsR family regulator
MLATSHSKEISQLFKMMGDPFRVQLLLALAESEACVCHLERVLGGRQAYISQHLMRLRETGWLTARREGKYIFYKMKDRGLLSLIRRAGDLLGLADISEAKMISKCECPNCEPSRLITIK